MIIRRIFALILAAALLLLSTSVVLAQPATLTYGIGVLGKVDAETPFNLYSFSGGEGDLVSVRVAALAPGFTSALSINGPNGQQLAFSTSDPYSPGMGNARFDVLLPQGGSYALQVSSADGSQGQFFLRLDGIGTANAPTLTPDAAPVELTFDPGTATQALAIAMLPDTEQTVTINGGETGFAAAYHAMDGALVDVLRPRGDGSVSLTIPADSSGDGGMVYLVVTNLDRSEATIEVSLVTGAAAPTANQTTAPAAPSGGDTCTITTGSGGTNLRQGPGTNYGIITTLPGDTTYTVTGQNNAWYTIDYNGQQGWLAGSVTTLAGPCAGVPLVSAPPAPSTAPSDPADPATTEEPSGQTGPTATPTPTTAGDTGGQTDATSTPSPPPTQAAQTAPPDDNYRITVDRDNGGTFSQVISYPDGDTSDQIEINMSLEQTGPNSQRDVSVTLGCSGTGIENVSFTRSSINAQRFGCGDTITFRYTFGFASQRYYVFIDSGSPSYVTYTLNITTAP
ncbi:MAG: SH3 domain-containing protein [Chloroflexota bacterium]